MTTTEHNQLITALQSMLSTFGFQKMAEDVVSETDIVRLKKYANVCVNACPTSKKGKLIDLFSKIGLR